LFSLLQTAKALSDHPDPIGVIARLDRAIQTHRWCLLDRPVEPGGDSDCVSI
jgi:hypothetical protein